ncbi:MAG: SusC/RagA family TonB-linked outer membrane protein [Bacteroidales bacterium]|jgi:TonB-linked SusC/RagA family outer membrane protein|nr:SusC/RagA family TonB-linked outer membrane protein [Bacteroidales bacterium]MCI2122469.1 SusC/RagA family TonB-linked outer membrane protein [Bacteroidales bacterium]MCI2144832.1 SusC/RagA family TonB-linked outer membrane protein [Bacteroidales bacterium]
MAANVYARDIQVSGIVTDAVSTEPLAGVTVMVKGTSLGTSTGADGSYSLAGVKEDAVLVFSCIGYVNVETGVSGRAVVNASLAVDKKMLSEVVVIGYGTMDKKELTSAIAHISSKDFLSTSVSDPLMLIQGKVSGVSVVNTGAADPNSSASIQIRGVSSRAAGLDPLVVIDGVPGGNMSNLNQNDIESIDILKDGAASAIYGTRGSNGVVLITTKKGKEDGSIHTSYYGVASANFMIKELDMLSADEYRQYRTSQGTSVDYGGNVDWLKEVSRVGLTHQHTLTLSGGNSRNNYRVSADYRKATGIDRRSEREEYGARASVSHTTKSGLFSFTANIAPRIVNAVGADWNVFHNAIEANPTSPIYDPDDPSMYFSFFGQQAGYNPVEAIYTVKDDREIKMLDWDATAKLNITDYLNTQITFADQQTDNYNGWFSPSTNTESISKGWSGDASRSYASSSQHSLEWLANYNRNFGDHNLKVMAGYSYQYFLNSGVSAENKNFPSDALTYNSIGQGEWAKEEGHVGMSSYKNDSKLIAFFGRVSYDYKGKYLATASLRHEGSSKFGANNKWGDFPAFSLGWRISKEKFMKNLSWINDLKLRADYGVTGNQNFDNYLSLNTMTGFGDYYYNGQYFTVWGPSKNVNPDLKWEKGINWNLGLDFSLFDNRISGSVNYFNRTEKDLLGDYNVSIPPYLFSTTFVNVGTMKNSGLEFDLHFDVVDKSDFKYSVDFVGSTMNNEFVSFSNSEYVGQDYYYVAATEDPFPFHYLQRIEKGKRLGTFYMLKFAGFTKDGDWVIYDKNNEYKLAANATDDDMREVGNGLPKFTASMTHSFSYGNWDLSLFFRGAFGFDLFNIHEFYYGLPDEVGNVMKQAYTKNANIKGNPVVCDYFLERGDYLKLDVVDLGYKFKLKSKYVENLRVYATGRNLATITGFTGVDPSTYQTNGLQPGATGSRNYYPSCRQVIFGVQIDF